VVSVFKDSAMTGVESFGESFTVIGVEGIGSEPCEATINTETTVIARRNRLKGEVINSYDVI